MSKKIKTKKFKSVTILWMLVLVICWKLKFASRQLLNFFRMFFFPFRVIIYSKKNKSKNNTYNKNKIKFIHYLPPLKYVPVIMKTINKIIPIIAVVQENFSPNAILAINKVIRSTCAKLKKTLDISSFCSLFNFISSIILQLKEFVKFMKNYLFGNVFRILWKIGTVPISM